MMSDTSNEAHERRDEWEKSVRAPINFAPNVAADDPKDVTPGGEGDDASGDDAQNYGHHFSPEWRPFNGIRQTESSDR
jgi:hypothetical protein